MKTRTKTIKYKPKGKEAYEEVPIVDKDGNLLVGSLLKLLTDEENVEVVEVPRRLVTEILIGYENLTCGRKDETAPSRSEFPSEDWGPWTEADEARAAADEAASKKAAGSDS